MCVCFIRICVVLLLFVSLVRTEVTIENGGYNVLVAFSQNVPAQIGIENIENIKASLERASEILHNAIGLQFSKVTFEIPDSWDVSEYNLTIEDSLKSDSLKADILIDNTNDTVFGRFPFAQQYGSCGVPGFQIILPTAFLHQNEFPKGIALAREWLKYRYGVFDENGYFDDPLYPLYYHTPGSNDNEVTITDCTNFEVTYNFTDREGNECPSDKMLIDKLKSHECVFTINEEDSENVHSSLMYFEESIKNMTDICGKDDDHPHNSRARNKQNVLCTGKSIWDVIKESADFQKGEIKKEYLDLEFVFSKKVQPRVVVAWENTEKLKNKGKIIMNAITKLMIDLPDGSKFRAFPFKENVADKEYLLQDLDDRQKIALDLKSDFVSKESGNFKAAFEKAISILRAADENSEEPPGNIIIVTGTEDNLIVVLLKDVNVCISVHQSSISENIDELTSNLPCLEVVRIPMSDESDEFYKKLIGTIEKICPSKIEDKLTEMVKTRYIEENIALDFEIDDLTETITLSIFADKESDNFNLELNGQKVEESKPAIYGNVLQLSYTLTEAGTINFTYPHETDPMLVEVKKTSKAGKYFSVEIKVHDTTTANDTNQMPVIIYAIVRFGSYPVQNATVLAIIQTPNGGRKTLIMNDDGRGDPDITQNDGVYSRYFIGFNGTGEYIVTVVIANKKFATGYGAHETEGYRSCCGSVVNGDATPKLSQFTKLFKTTFTTELDRPEDGYKPSRITDLRIASVTDDGIVLKWTAPGEEADYGLVQSYEIKSFTSSEDAKTNFDDGGELLNYEFISKDRGETQELKINYNDFEKNGLYYIAMKTKNLNNKKSDISTIVEVYISNRETTDAPGKETNISKTSPKTIGLIVGLIVGLIILMILIYVVIYFVIVKPKRKKQQKENPIYDNIPKRTENKEVNPISSVSADTLMKHHNEKMKAKTENKEPPIFKEEDFENRNFQSTNESSASSNDQEQENSHKNPRNGQPFPPKSPKRITPV